MLFLTILKVSLKSLSANKLRTLLSMLGIIIGVGAVISMLALGTGAQKQVLSQIQAMGTDMLIVRPGQKGFRGVAQGNQDNLTLQDAESLMKRLPAVSQIAPVVSGSVQIKYFSQNVRSTMTGTAITYFQIRNFEVEKGRSFTESETEAHARVAVIGPLTAENLFGQSDPLEKTIKLNGVNFKVVGILKSKGDQGWFNPDDQVLIPYTTAMAQVLGVEFLREIDLQITPGQDINAAQEQATQILRQNHRTQPGEEDSFNIRNQAETIETASNFSRIFTILLGGIASISLLVGGIGIMNIMLVTVTERTREIGVRKAIGAKKQDILLQFLMESILLSCTGGFIGVLVGVVLALVIGQFTQFPAIIEPLSVILAFSFAGGVGVFFGFYPAQKAASLNPIEALRYE
ncbi:ABC transporter permease [Vampirovibrio sp.]|uniref:ABC transporter permease n=1 Tax=Vampirovibrio sp. TaxID=2717857 RepID=UPI0035945931